MYLYEHRTSPHCARRALFSPDEVRGSHAPSKDKPRNPRPLTRMRYVVKSMVLPGTAGLLWGMRRALCTENLCEALCK